MPSVSCCMMKRSPGWRLVSVKPQLPFNILGKVGHKSRPYGTALRETTCTLEKVSVPARCGRSPSAILPSQPALRWKLPDFPAVPIQSRREQPSLAHRWLKVLHVQRDFEDCRSMADKHVAWVRTSSVIRRACAPPNVPRRQKLRGQMGGYAWPAFKLTKLLRSGQREEAIPSQPSGTRTPDG